MDTLLPFAGLAALIVLTPGPDLMLVTRSVLASGRHAGLRTAAGISTGSATWALAAAVGLAALLSASPDLLTIIRLAGAGYLAWIGVRALRSSFPIASEATGDPTTSVGRWTDPFRTGLVSNLLHPGQIVFYTSMLPQFIDPVRDPTPQVLALGAVFVAIVLTWFATYAVLLSKVGMERWDAIAPRLTQLTGVVLIGLAVRMAARV